MTVPQKNVDWITTRDDEGLVMLGRQMIEFLAMPELDAERVRNCETIVGVVVETLVQRRMGALARAAR